MSGSPVLNDSAPAAELPGPPRPVVIGWGRSEVINSAGWRLRVRWPLEWLRSRGLVRFGGELDETRRTPEPTEPALVLTFGLWTLNPAAIRNLRAQGHRIVGSLDDNYWDLPPWQTGPDQPSEIQRARACATIEAVLRELDVVAVTTSTLADVVARYTAQPVVVIPNAIPLDRIALGRPNMGRRVRLGWAGTRTHHGDWDAVRPAIEQILERPDVWLVLLTRDPPRWLACHPRVEVRKPVEFDSYYARLADLHLDIGLAPLAADPFNESKSNLKLLDYGALGLPAVASRVGPYRNLPTGQTCITVPDNDSAEWAAALTTLIDDPARRRAMGAAAREWVAAHGSLDLTGPAWASALGLQADEATHPETADAVS